MHNHLHCEVPSPTEIFVRLESSGPKGDKGDSLKFEDLTEEQKAELKGPPGEPGRTPERGVDYWTEADKQEIKSEIDLTDYQKKLNEGANIHIDPTTNTISADSLSYILIDSIKQRG